MMLWVKINKKNVDNKKKRLFRDDLKIKNKQLAIIQELDVLLSNFPEDGTPLFSL